MVSTISLTALKQVCRTIGVPRWPYQRGAQHVCATSGGEDTYTLPSLEIETAPEAPCCVPQARPLLLVP